MTATTSGPRPFLTIGIPLYNNQAFITECLQSIYDQGLPESEFEVIVVNDGSTDNSLEIATAFLANHTNGRVIDKANEGSAVARNVCIDHASGTYIHFIDSDDKLMPGCYRRIIPTAQSLQPDVVDFKCTLDTTGQYPTPDDVRYYTSVADYLSDLPFMSVHIWRKFYKTDMLRRFNIRYLKQHIYGHDWAFSFKVFAFANTFLYIPVYAYFFRVNDNSVTRRRDTAHRHRLIKAQLLVEHYLHNYMHIFSNPTVAAVMTRLRRQHIRYIMDMVTSADFDYRMFSSLLAPQYTKIYDVEIDSYPDKMSVSKYKFFYRHPLIYYLRLKLAKR